MQWVNVVSNELRQYAMSDTHLWCNGIKASLAFGSRELVLQNGVATCKRWTCHRALTGEVSLVGDWACPTVAGFRLKYTSYQLTYRCVGSVHYAVVSVIHSSNVCFSYVVLITCFQWHTGNVQGHNSEPIRSDSNLDKCSPQLTWNLFNGQRAANYGVQRYIGISHWLFSGPQLRANRYRLGMALSNTRGSTHFMGIISAEQSRDFERSCIVWCLVQTQTSVNASNATE